MSDTQLRYRAYLLRLWQERSEEGWVWRASLEDPHSHERKGFANLERLVAYLKEQTEGNPAKNNSDENDTAEDDATEQANPY